MTIKMINNNKNGNTNDNMTIKMIDNNHYEESGEYRVRTIN